MQVLSARGHQTQTLHSRPSHTVAAGIAVVEVAVAEGATGTVVVAVPHSMTTDLTASGADHKKAVGAVLVSETIAMVLATWTRTCDLVMPLGMTVNLLYENHPAILGIFEILATPSTVMSARATTGQALWPTSH